MREREKATCLSCVNRIAEIAIVVVVVVVVVVIARRRSLSARPGTPAPLQLSLWTRSGFPSPFLQLHPGCLIQAYSSNSVWTGSIPSSAAPGLSVQRFAWVLVVSLGCKLFALPVCFAVSVPLVRPKRLAPRLLFASGVWPTDFVVDIATNPTCTATPTTCVPVYVRVRVQTRLGLPLTVQSHRP
ncbi:hypothetical protein QBC32DRAFT_167082 [Pseudoneurospora amorphoporcata]|uniref:Uncharacterized protein n=1 Tax=Pseudoneurospora amorphoporcata TaxID=241081 RepID=A0AAN6SF22_9PEZI|nr:hypothetical protein QBC32DRAFT_167082 [Pseudoneurospora amorphoporcata]